MDAMVDATELWSLDAYAGLPRVNPQHPIISIDDPNLVFFLVPEAHKRGKHYFNQTIWKIIMDTRSKTLVSVCRYDDKSQRQPFYEHTYLPSKITDYFATHGSCSNVTTKAAATVNKLPITADIISNSLQSLSFELSAKHL
ncbi:hypothetical protein E2562_016517 [Oryza meyeriana var. granulata]|uniref:DUF1618 domain-containing protein n=1 Tax=Oryza meyeriana var. granulata TaxID=110450 RepID=A0A6G1C7L0_9ORYZ|nr:hypothetical protein E2562_016517 [Oryza meyeriana var. granulata]